MSYRYMRVMVFFDLPTGTIQEKRAYRQFRKFLLASGFLMMQESVYSKLALNAQVAERVMNDVRQNSPVNGLIQMMMVTEKQYNNIELVIGENQSEVINSTERLVVL